MIFYWINRIILGDTLFGLAIWLGCITACFLASQAKRWPVWIRCLYAVALSFGLMVIAHCVIDKLQIFWVTPLGPHMNLHD